MTRRPAPDSQAEAGTVGAAASTRQRVRDILLERGPLTAGRLAQSLGLTSAGVRRHLSALVESGEIAVCDQPGPRRRGRPAKTYQLTPAGRQGFGDAYGELAMTALTELVAAVGPEAVDRLAQKRLAELEDDYLRRRAARPGSEPAELLAETLNAAGYFASAHSDGELCQHHCPVAHVAARFPQLCEAETAVFARLLGTDVSRLATIALGDQACRSLLGGRTRPANPAPASADRKVSA